MRRIVIEAALLCALLPGCSTGPTRDGVDGIILFTLDTTRADRIGCYGHADAVTPGIDRMAKEGILFDACIASVPTTLASHASLFSSLSPRSHGVPRNGFQFPDDILTITEIFRERGFRTAAMIGAFPLHSQFGLNRGFEVYDEELEDNPYGGEVERPADSVGDRAVEWLSEVGDEPFFLWVHFFDSHWPYNPPEPYGRLRGEVGGEFDPASLDDLFAIRFNRRPFTENDLEAFRRAYDGEVAFIDRHIRRVIDAVPPQRRDDILFALTADHGESFGEHRYYFDHGHFLWDNETRVPLILHSAKLIGKPAVVSEPVRIIDIGPTLLDAAGIRPPGHFEGETLLGVLDGRLEPRIAISEASKPWDVEVPEEWQNQYKAKSVRTADWKYVILPSIGQKGLFDLRADPGETHNVYKSNAETVHQLEEMLTTWMKETDPGFQMGDLTTDDEVRKKLEALQYVR